jgi:predicted membrane protein
VLTLALLFASSAPDWDEDGDGPGGGVGNREYQPTSVEDIQPVYRLGAGNMEIDLSDIDADDLDGREIRIDQDLGNLQVEVPEDADVRVVLTQDGGNTEIFGQSGDGYFRAEDGDRDPELVLTIDHGVGNVEVDRA